MANISSADGTIKLRGRWTQKALNMFIPILKVWSFEGEYGIQWCQTPSMQEKTVEFSGCGRWTFSSTSEEFDTWTRRFLQEKNGQEDIPTLESYREFLTLMEEKKLTIEFDFTDKESGVGFYNHEVGRLVSHDGQLNYQKMKCEAITNDQSGLDDAVYFFAQFLTNADSDQLRIWVEDNMDFTDTFRRWGIDEYSQILYELLEFGEDPFPQFSNDFSPDTKAWVNFCSEYLDIQGHMPDEAE